MSFFIKYIINFYLSLLYCVGIAQEGLINVSTLPTNFELEIKYASTQNFTNTKLYDCPRCYLQKEVAWALKKANDSFCELGYKIKLYDCYRPLSVQKKMWSIFPNPKYVANPYAKTSIHTRAAAVDLTLVTLEGCEVNMGTDYDFFGKEAHTDYNNLPKEVLQNRKILQDVLRYFGFSPIRTEWWHFSYKKNYAFKVLDIPFNCENNTLKD